MNWTKLASIAWRNLWRQRRRTLLTLASITFGGFFAVFMTGMSDQTFADFIDTAARLGNGHVIIQHADYLDKPSLKRTVLGTDELTTLAAGTDGVSTVVERISGEVMVATAEDSFGAAFIAYDPAGENDETFSMLEGIDQGEMFKTSSDKGIILGKKLASNLDAQLGDKIVYTMMDKRGEIVSGMGRLSGTIGTGAPSMDAALVLLPLEVVRDLLGYEAHEATHVAVFIEDSRDADKISAAIKEATPESSAAVLTWSEAAPDLRSFIAMKVGGGRVMEIIIGLLVAAGIFNTLFISIMERMREFGVMIAIGYTPGQLFKMVMWESLWLGLVGLVTSALVTAGPYYYLATTGLDLTQMYEGQPTEVGGVGFDMTLHFGIFPENGVIIALAILFATLAAGLYPAWRAGRVDPIESIKLV